MAQTKPKVYIIGVGMTPFYKPQSTDLDYPDLVKVAVNEALDDAGLKYKDVQQATVSYIIGGTCSGQRALYEIGLTGIPIFNVNNACASGSSGVFLCKQIIESGNADVVLAVGFEKMEPGSLNTSQTSGGNRALSVDKHIELMNDTFGLQPAPITAQMFGNAGIEHMQKYGTKREHFAKIGYKNHLHSVNNPKSQFRKKYSLDEVINARKIYDFMGLLECSPTSDGAAAVVIVSEKFLQQNPRLKPQAVEIVGMVLGTDEPSVFAEKSNIKMIGFDMVRKISDRLYKETGFGPNDIQAIELHDCFSANELITYEALGLCPIGKAAEIIDRNDNTYGGKWVINPSGGLISKGHPIGATGVAQAVELSNQLRGRCELRQVPNCKLALQHNIGIGGAGVVALYRLGFPSSSPSQAQIPSTLFKSDVIFEEIRQRAATEKRLVKEVNAVYLFNINSGKNIKRWFIDLKQNPAFVGENSTAKPDAEFIIKDDDFMKLAAGEIRADQAFMQGKMKIKGNIMKAMKLKSILDPAQLKAKI